MAAERIEQLPVLDGGRKVVGVITALDVMRWLARQSGLRLAGPGAGTPG